MSCKVFIKMFGSYRLRITVAFVSPTPVRTVKANSPACSITAADWRTGPGLCATIPPTTRQGKMPGAEGTGMRFRQQTVREYATPARRTRFRGRLSRYLVVALDHTSNSETEPRNKNSPFPRVPSLNDEPPRFVAKKDQLFPRITST